VLKADQMLNSNALSTATGGSFYVSVKTPNTFAKSTISSQNRLKSKYSMFKGENVEKPASEASS